MSGWENLLCLKHAVRRRWRPLILLLLALIGIGLSVPHLKAWYHYRAGKTALKHYHAGEALEHLNACLRTWPDSKDVQLLAARAARRADRLDEAVRHLEVCDKHWADAKEVLLEWALQHAAAGDLASVEHYLQSRLQNSFWPDGPLICEALVVGYLRMYRFHTAALYLAQWLEHEPDNVQALFLRATVWRSRGKPPQAAEDYRRVLQLDPQRGEARWDLALCLMETYEWEEALSLLDQVLRQRPNDPDVYVRIAVCRHGLGQTQQAREVLDRVLHEHPAHGMALRERGWLALQDEQPTDAERWLRQAVTILPQDIHAHRYLAEALLPQRKTEEAKTEQSRADQLQSWQKRLQKISEQELANRPYDPSLFCEIGLLETRLGRPNRGYRWLLLALTQAPNAAPVHAALAEYYEQQGDSAQAASHRRLAQEASGSATKH
jgi:tetratricopeptide (TPR) repeat protein